MDTTHNALLRTACTTYLPVDAHANARTDAHANTHANAYADVHANTRANARALALVRTVQTHHHNLQAVPCTPTWHRRHRRGQCASPGTCKRCPA